MTGPQRFRKKPVEIEAIRIAPEINEVDFLDPNTRSQAVIAGWMLGHGFNGFKVHGEKRPFGIAIETLEGVMVAEPGDWIIRGTRGEFYPCKPGPFADTYDVVRVTDEQRVTLVAAAMPAEVTAPLGLDWFRRVRLVAAVMEAVNAVEQHLLSQTDRQVP